MKSESRMLLHSRKIQIAIVVVMMGLSIYLPYMRSLSYVYQIAAVGLMVLLCGTTGYAIIPLLVLSTTRSYIAVSTQDTFSLYFGLNGAILALSMIMLLFLAWRKHDFRIKYRNGIACSCFFGAILFMSRLWASTTLEYGDNLNAICLMYITIPFLFETKQDVVASKIAFTLSGFFAGIGIVPHLLNVGTIYEFSVSVDRNYQSCFLLMCTLQTVSLLMQEWQDMKAIHKMFCFVSILLDLYIIVTSASRSAFIAMGIAIAVYLLLNIKNIKTTFAAILIGGIIISYVYELGMFDFILERFSLSNVSTGNGRTDLWAKYLSRFSEGNPLRMLFGHGIVGQTDFGLAAHNTFVSVLYYLGILGLLLLVSTIVSAAISFIKNKEYQEFVSLIPIMFMCCTIEPYYRIEFAIYLATIVGMSNYYMMRGTKEDVS